MDDEKKPSSARPEETPPGQSMFAVARRRMSVILITSVITLTTVATLTLLQTPVYQVECRMMVSSPRGGMGGLGMMGEMPSLLGLNFGSSSAETQRLLLKSPWLLEKAASDVGLDWSMEELTLRVEASVVEGSDLLAVRVTYEDPQKAVKLADQIAEIHIEKSKALARESTAEAAKFIYDEMQRIEDEMLLSEEELLRYMEDQDIVYPEAETQATLEALAGLAGEAAGAKAAAAESRRMADELRRQLEEADETIMASSTIARNPLVQQLEGELATLEVERAGLLAQFQPGHERILQADQSIEEAKVKLLNAVETVVADETVASNPYYLELLTSLTTSEASAMAAQARASALQQIIDAERQRLGTLPSKVTTFGQKELRATIAAKIYSIWAEKYNEMKLNEALTLSNIRITDDARVPEEPAKPKKLLNAVLGFALAILLSVLFAGIAEVRDHSIRSQTEAHWQLGLKTLGTVPNAPAQEVVLSGDVAPSAMLESFRNLRANLLASQPEGEPLVTLITSPEARDGKSVVAVNLAVALAQGGLRTLIIDANLRRPSVAQMLSGASGEEAAAAETGLVDLLVDGGDALSLAQPTTLDNLSVLPAGAPTAYATELLSSPHAERVLQEARSGFDAIIIDSAPCSALADPLALAPLCNQVLLVLRLCKTRRDRAQQAAGRLQNLPAPTPQLILNAQAGPKGWYDY